jgi:hypothetical protein
VILARAFGARVDLLLAEPQLAAPFASRCVTQVYDEVTILSLSRNGEPLNRVLLRRIHERPPDLVIKSPSGAHPLLTWSLHASDRELAAQSPVPVVLAGSNAWSRPMRLGAAVDVSDAETTTVACAILQAAGFLSLGIHGTLDVLYSEREERDERVRMERAVKVAQLVREFHVGADRLHMMDGAPERKLPPLITARQYDLLVLGAATDRERHASPPDTLTGQLVDAGDGDVVLVRPAGVPRVPTGNSFREKPLHYGQQFV